MASLRLTRWYTRRWWKRRTYWRHHQRPSVALPLSFSSSSCLKRMLLVFLYSPFSSSPLTSPMGTSSTFAPLLSRESTIASRDQKIHHHHHHQHPWWLLWSRLGKARSLKKFCGWWWSLTTCFLFFFSFFEKRSSIQKDTSSSAKSKTSRVNEEPKKKKENTSSLQTQTRFCARTETRTTCFTTHR